jgi:hypothetical protein
LSDQVPSTASPLGHIPILFAIAVLLVWVWLQVLTNNQQIYDTNK